MSIPGAGNPLLLGGAGGYKIERSLRFNSADSAYLSRTPASAGNRKTWTWSGWVKRSGLLATGDHTLFSSGTTLDNTLLAIGFRYDALLLADYASNRLATAQLFRDTSSWYHIVVAVDTTSAVANNRQKMYVNGNEVASFSERTNYSQNDDTGFGSTVIHQIGRSTYFGGNYFPGYLADVHFIDGQALTPNSFGETDINGVWQPKKYSGSYGTNGFKLAFADNSAATATTLGKDTSGNGNNWTPNNLSVTAGVGNDSLVDSPTNYGTDTGAGGEVRGNYCTLNPLSGNASHPLANGNLEVVSTSGSGNRFGTIGVSSGKWYWECAYTTLGPSASSFGVSSNGYQSNDTAGLRVYENSGTKYNGSSSSSYGASWTVNDVIGVALDADNGTLAFYKNNAAQGTAFTGLTGTTWYPVVRNDGGGTGWINFGQRPFAYTAPSGFKALCTQNLPAPTITKPSTVMDVKLYTGNGSTQTISGLGFSPDLVWYKQRDVGRFHRLYDTIRGSTNALRSDSTSAEELISGLTAFTSTGFTVGSDLGGNENNGSYVAWAWDAGSSTVTNTDGTITSQVRANASAGFSVVTYTGDGSASATVGHGLGVAPRLYITKCRDSTGTPSDNWGVFTTATGSMLYGFLNTTASFGTPSQSAPTSTTINVVSGFENVSGKRFVAYCFAPVAGYSAFGSYTGNGSADGPFVYTGFRPALVIIKNSSGANNWLIFDNKRDGSNVNNDQLYPNTSAVEDDGQTNNFIDLLSNGFKFRNAATDKNANAGTYIYAAFAEAPFAYSRAR